MTTVTCDYCGESSQDSDHSYKLELRPVSVLSGFPRRSFDLCPACASKMIKYVDAAFTKNLLGHRLASDKKI